MAAKTSIAWTDSTLPVHAGCKEVSPGCKNCYSARLTATRLSKSPKYRELAIIGQNNHPHFTGETRFWREHLDWPLRWTNPRKIFVDDMSDLFYEEVPRAQIVDVFAVMALSGSWREFFGINGHTFQVLTKRAQRMHDIVNDPLFRIEVAEAIPRIAEEFPSTHATRGRWPNDVADAVWHSSSGWPLPSVWNGVSVESQRYADERVPWLLETQSAVRFLSCEPLLEALDLTLALDPCEGPCENDGTTVDMVIVGGESSRKASDARPFDLAWARSILAQCSEAKVAAFFKQSGSRAFDSSDARVGVRGPDMNGTKSTYNRDYFTSFEEWVAKANGWIGGTGAICVDAKRRILERGADFMRARDEDAFPVQFYRLLDVSGKGEDLSEFPEELRIRDFPVTAEQASR